MAAVLRLEGNGVRVDLPPFALGGLIGANGGIVTASFRHMDTSGQTTSAGGTGEHTSAGTDEASFTNAATHAAAAARSAGRVALDFVFALADAAGAAIPDAAVCRLIRQPSRTVAAPAWSAVSPCAGG